MPLRPPLGSGTANRDDKVSNRLDTSKEAVVSNKDVEKLGIPHLMHSHAMLLPNDDWCISIGELPLGGLQRYRFVTKTTTLNMT